MRTAQPNAPAFQHQCDPDQPRERAPSSSSRLISRRSGCSGSTRPHSPSTHRTEYHWMVATTPSGEQVLAAPMTAANTNVCAMEIYVKLSADSYLPYHLSGGP